MNASMQLFTGQRIATSMALLALALNADFASGQVMIDPLVPPPGGSGLNVRGINNRGQLVGFWGDPAGQHAFLYQQGQMFELPGLGGSIRVATAINTAGDIIGDSGTLYDAENHAFLYQGGTLTDLGTLGGTASSAVALNETAQVVGYSYSEGDMQMFAFIYQNGTMTNLGTLGGSYSTATGINNTGQVIGHSGTLGDLATHGFLYKNGQMLDLGTLGGSDSYAYGINDLGQVIGDSLPPTGWDAHGFLYQNGTNVDLGTLGGTFSTAKAINSAGQIIGDSSTAASQYHGFIYQSNRMTDLGTLGGTYSMAAAVNNAGQVVGEASDLGETTYAFIWQNGQMINLNSLVTNTDWYLYTATAINDLGQIVGYGLYRNEFTWYLLAMNLPPVSEAGPDQTVECGTAAVLDGSQSSDPDNDPITFEWREGGTLLGTNAQLSVTLALGSHTITLRVTDRHGASAEDSLLVTVRDTLPPTVTCPMGFTVLADLNCQGTVPDVLAQVVATDICTAGPELVRAQNPPAGALVPLGTNVITVTVTDGSGNTASCATPVVVIDQIPPVITCPAPVTVAADQNCQGTVPDMVAGVVASDNCTPGPALIRVQNPPAGALLPLGTNVITVTVSDASGNSASCTTVLVVIDQTPPALTCPAPTTLAADQNCQAVVPDLLAQVVAADNCTAGPDLVLVQNPPAGALVPLGTNVITITVTDAAGNTSSGTALVIVTDQTAPVIQSLTATPSVLDQANRAMVPVSITVAAVDNCDAAPVSRILSISSDEPVTGPGDNTSPDWQITGDLTALVRAERSAQGDGRTYTFLVECRDAAGNATAGTVTVIVLKKRAH